MKKILNNFQLILEDLLEFFYNQQSEKIKNLKEIINKIKNGPLNYFEREYINNEEVKELLKTKEKAKERAIKKKSEFFQTILQNSRKKYKYDDDCIKETEEQFKKLENIFSSKGIQCLYKDENILKHCLNTIKGKKEKEIINEIDILIDIFGNNINKAIYNKKEITKSLIILSKKED